METQKVTVKVIAQMGSPCSDREYASCFAEETGGKKLQPYNVGIERDEDKLVIFQHKYISGGKIAKPLKVGDTWLVCNGLARAEVMKVE